MRTIGNLTVSGSLSTSGSITATTFIGVVSSSAQLSTEISGAFASVSASIASDIQNNDTRLSSLEVKTLVSSSAQLSDTTIPGNLTVGGILTAQEFHTEFVSASIVFQSGSTQFGNSLDDVHNFSGSLAVNTNNLFVSGGNVGIGTTSPSEKLSVVGKIALNDGGNSVFIGDDAGLNDDGTDNFNVGIGYEALLNNTTGNINTAIGFRALRNNTTGERNTAIGYEALRNNTTGERNLANGFAALYSNTTGDNNTAIGYAALYINTEGYNNTAIGYLSLRNNTTGVNNTANGLLALYSNTTGNDNVANGYQAGRYRGSGTLSLTTASGSLFLGSNTRASANNSTNEIVIGTDAIGNGDNSVTIGNDGTIGTATSKTILNGNVGIGTDSPTTSLQINKNSTSGASGGISIKTDDSNESLISIGVSTSLGRAFISSLQNGTGSQLPLDFITGNSSTNVRMRIAADGNVGIGTTSPSTKLHISGPSASLKVENTTSARVDVTQIDLTGTVAGSGAGNERAILFGRSAFVERQAKIAYGQGSSNGQFPYLTFSTGDNVNSLDEHMRITSAGNVGIGTTSPSYKLHVNGSVAGVGSYVNLSDVNYKTNIYDLNYGINEIKQLRPVTYKWKNIDYGTRTNIGFLAQEVELVMPELVISSDEDVKSMASSDLIAVLTKATQEQQEEIDLLKQQIEMLIAEINALKNN